MLLAAIQFSWAQSETGEVPKLSKATIKIAPLHFFTNTFQFGTELFNNSHSRSFNLDIGLKTSSSEFDDASGYSLEAGYRKYVKPMTYREGKGDGFHQGIYYNFYLQGGYFQGSGYYSNFFDQIAEDYDVKITYFSPGFYLGLQRTLWEVIFLDVYIGGGFKISNIDHTSSYLDRDDLDYNVFEAGYEGIYPKLGVKLGIGL